MSVDNVTDQNESFNDDTGSSSLESSLSEDNDSDSTISMDDTDGDNEFQGYNIANTTERALTHFERFISNEWPKQATEGNDEVALEMLRLQLLHGGGFCTNMKLIDLSTPNDVRLNIQNVLALLQEKMSQCTVTSVEKFVLPNVKEFTAGDEVKTMLGDFCGVLCGESKRINEVVIKCEEISNTFTAGNLEWVEDFLSCYNLDTVAIYPAKKSSNKEYVTN